jgi:hypothetical protein
LVSVSLSCAALLATFEARAAAEPIKIAVFDFELEDLSAAVAGTPESDVTQLASVTEMVRKAFAQSDRYTLIDVANVEARAAKTHTLRECDGCEAGLASKLGAEQSFVGVVSRISRTEYIVKFRIRDARTGAVVSEGDSGLRMGADYSWGRGATRLIKDRVLEALR